jgi:putative tricarboxylic transport membrane protein
MPIREFAAKAIFPAVLGIFFLSSQALGLEPPKRLSGYPKQKIEYVVRWAAGGGADAYARHFAKVAKEKLGLDFVVVNMPGAAGLTALPYFMDQPADGYTILNMDINFVVGSIQGKTKVNIRDLIHICRVQYDTEVFFVRPNDARFPNIQAMVKWAKDHPNTLTFSTEGAGQLGDIVIGKLEKMMGFTSKKVPYAKFGERVAAVVGGHVDVLYEEAGDVAPYVNDGQMKPILVFLKTKIPYPPYDKTTTTADLGLDHDLAFWRSIAVKKGTSMEIVRYLEQVFKFYSETNEGKELARQLLLDFRPGFIGMEETEKFTKEQEVSLRDIMKSMGMIK